MKCLNPDCGSIRANEVNASLNTSETMPSAEVEYTGETYFGDCSQMIGTWCDDCDKYTYLPNYLEIIKEEFEIGKASIDRGYAIILTDPDEGVDKPLRMEAELFAARQALEQLLDTNLNFYAEAFKSGDLSGSVTGSAWFYVDGMISSIQDALDPDGGRAAFLASLKDEADRQYEYLLRERGQS